MKPWLFLGPGLLLFLWFGRYVLEAIARADSMLERLYTLYRREWVAAGAPKGWAWSPPLTSESDGSHFLSLAAQWAASRPMWSTLDQEMSCDFERWLYCYRRLTIWFILSMASFGLGVLGLIILVVSR